LFDLWLYRITVNEAYDYLRRRHCREPWISDLSEEQMVTAYAMAGRKVASDREYQKRIRETVDDLLAAIPEADRILLVLREIEGLSANWAGSTIPTRTC